MDESHARVRAGAIHRGSGSRPEAPTEPPPAGDGGRSPFYVRYIGSARWLESPARQGELIASGYRCRVCNAGPPEARLEVHHRTYARLGRERGEDLTTLCQPCHRAVTSELRRRKAATRAWATRDVERVTPRTLPRQRPGEA